MPLYKPSELRNFLGTAKTAPKKGLSQNFLIDGNIIKKIVDVPSLSPGDLVLEIGPGPGAMTEALLQKEVRIVAVEKDRVLAQELSRLDQEKKQLQIHCQDILDFDLDVHFKPLLKQGEKGKVIANLPYHITTPILAMLIKRSDLFSEIVVMVQDEVAKRFTASAKNKEYGSFTVFLNYYSSPRYAFGVKRSSFFPAPKVDSAIVSLQLHEPGYGIDEEKFFTMTRRAFEQRRKMLKVSLKDLYSSQAVMDALKQCGLNPLSRPEELSLAEFISLFQELLLLSK